jgi:hypothetical protein
MCADEYDKQREEQLTADPEAAGAQQSSSSKDLL